jgi:hypothetical protein
MTRYARWLLAASAALGTAGCATYNTATLVWPSLDRLDQGVHVDLVFEVKAGYRDPAGDVLVCVRGRPAGRAWWLDNTDFALVVSRRVVAGGDAPRIRRGSWAPSRYVPPPEDIRSSCPVAGDKTYPALPMVRFKAEDFGARVIGDVPRDKVRALIRDQAGPALCVISGKSWQGSSLEDAVIVYVHDAVIALDSPALEIDTEPRQVGSQPAWALALPFALAFDIVTFPFQLLALLAGH